MGLKKSDDENLRGKPQMKSRKVKSLKKKVRRSEIILFFFWLRRIYLRKEKTPFSLLKKQAQEKAK